MIKKKLFIAFSALALSICFIVNLMLFTTNVNAKIFKDPIRYHGDKGGAGTLVCFDAQHQNEISNFASVNDATKSFYTNPKINENIYKKPSANENYNNMDYVVYMVDRLEKLAMEYTGYDRKKANNCVFGYIRGINKSYCDKEENGGAAGYIESIVAEWTLTAGKIDKEFVNFVASNEKVDEITFPEFFASFVQDSNNYNSYLYGAVNSSFLNKHYKVPDPLGTGQSIDLLHMFAAIDGIYLNTEHNKFACDFALGSVTIQRDIVSWLGDLHQLINSLKDKDIEEKTYSLAEGYIDFNTYLGGGSGFPSDDLLADIDAFNITKFFIDCEKNYIVNAFYGYYNSINKNKAVKGNRFYEFIYTATVDLECATMPNIVESFRRSACTESNVGYENGRYWEADIRSGVRVHLMGGAGYQTRKICTKLFCDYIITLSGRTD